MKIIIAECSVVYAGRGNTIMDRAIRSIIIKNDGAIGIHNDVGNKPLNYMGKGNVFSETLNNKNEKIWRFETRKEYIEITLYNIIHEFFQELDDGSVPIVRDGTEYDLQKWLYENPTVIKKDLSSIQREYETSAGAIDLLCEDKNYNLVGIEVKRIAMLGAVDQCSRYREALREKHSNDTIEVILAALDVRPNTAKLAHKRNIPFIIIPQDWNNNSSITNIKIVDENSLF